MVDTKASDQGLAVIVSR